jgi:hypothetical protein
VIAASGFDIKQERMVSDLQFRSENRFDARALRRLRKLDRAVQVADIGQGDGRQTMLLGAIDDGSG